MGFIETMRSQGHAVESICRLLSEQGCQVAARTYRDWKAGGPAPRTVSDAHVIDVVRDVCWTKDADGGLRLAPEGLYGRRKLTAYLQGTRLPGVAECTVARCMKTLGHQGVRRAKTHRTTIPSKDGKRAGDLLNRDWSASGPNQKWVTDFTYCRTWAGFVYVTFILDCFSQRIVAWHASTCKSTELVMTPLRIALWQRDRDGHPAQAGELICHSDAGSQYTSVRFTEHLALEGIRPSIGSVGDAYDNALMETVNGLFKTECIRTPVFHRGPYKTLADVEFATAGWVDWYNHRRLHSSLGMLPPAIFEQAHYAALNPVGSTE
jgi:transposase InsO family protein